MTCPLAKPAGPRPPGQSSCATPCCLAGCRPRLQGAALGHPQSQATRSSALGPQRCRYRRHGSPAPGGATSSHNADRLEAEKCDSDAPVYRCRGAYATASRCLSMTSPKLFCTPDHTRSTRISHERLTSFDHTKQRTTTDLVLPQPDIRLLVPHCRLAKANV